MTENPNLRGQGINPQEFVTRREPYTQFQTWLADTRGVIGCPINCQYCFFKLDGKTPVKPHIDINPTEMIDLLRLSPSYHPGVPVNFGSETDLFSTPQNIDYYYKLLQLYSKSDYPNPVILISKRSIPDKFIDLALKSEKKILFYMSYSGLAGTDVEPNVNPEAIRDNFVRLKSKGIPAIHYWRPFLPQNSHEEKLDEVLTFITQYATCSVINGLRLNDGIRANMAKFWPELMDQEYDFSKSGEFWPESLRGHLIKRLAQNYPDYPAYFGNTPCSAVYAQEISDSHGLFNGRMCKESQCPPAQRLHCVTSYARPDEKRLVDALSTTGIEPSQVLFEEDKIVVSGRVDAGKLVYLRTFLKFPVISDGVDYKKGYNWAQVNENGGIIEVPWRDNWLKK